MTIRCFTGHRRAVHGLLNAHVVFFLFLTELSRSSWFKAEIRQALAREVRLLPVRHLNAALMTVHLNCSLFVGESCFGEAFKDEIHSRLRFMVFYSHICHYF